MGWFGKDKNQGAPEAQEVSETDLEYGDKTQYIQMVDERPRECVGWVVVLNGPQKGQALVWWVARTWSVRLRIATSC